MIMKTLEKLKENKHLISEPYTNDKGELIRVVDGKEIIQIPEDAPEQKRKNELINLWRIRNK